MTIGDRSLWFQSGVWVLVSREAFYWTGVTDAERPVREWWSTNLRDAKTFPSIRACYRAAEGYARLNSGRPRRLELNA